MNHFIQKEKIGLPTNGARILSEELSSDEKYLKVLGEILPIDESAPSIMFQVNLPKDWNGKLLHYGGGGLNGMLITAEYQIPGQSYMEETPLEQGYVTFGSDSGHQGDFWDGSFALKEEALENFAHKQLKKVKDVACEIVREYYQKEIDKVYFCGSSNGGREALKVAQEYPEDYDGVICLFPAYNWIGKALAEYRNARKLEENHGAGWVSVEELDRVKEIIVSTANGRVYEQGDYVEDISIAEKKQDEIILKLKEALSTEQIEVLETFDKTYELPFALQDGYQEVYGYGTLTGTKMISEFANVIGSEPGAKDGTAYVFSQNIIKYFIVRDADFDINDFDPKEWEKEIKEASELLDAAKLNLDGFRKRGGKLILIQGLEDLLVGWKNTRAYHECLAAHYGKEDLDEFVRYFEVPGYGHGFGTFNMATDLLNKLDRWVCKGKAPKKLVVEDLNFETMGRKQKIESK